MLENYQDEVALKKSIEPIKPHEIATIGTVYSDGVTLIFDDSTTESTKHYKRNKSITFVAGNRVKVRKYSGTYIVEYTI